MPGDISLPETSREAWAKEIAFAQTITRYFFKTGMDMDRKESLERRKYDEIEQVKWGGDFGLCHDCHVQLGQYHVPGCDIERCPKCDGQAISCTCKKIETWHKLPTPDKEVLLASVKSPQKATGTIDPIVSYANGRAIIERFHIVEDDDCYIVLVRNQTPDVRLYQPTPWLFGAALKALRELPPLEDE